MANPHFELMRHDAILTLYIEVVEVYSLTCPASPVHYQRDPLQNTKACVHVPINMLSLAN